MIANRKELLDAAMELPDEDRAEIAQRLFDSLPPDASFPLSDSWIAEAERRVRDIRDGNSPTVPHEEVVRGIDQQFQIDKSEMPT